MYICAFYYAVYVLYRNDRFDSDIYGSMYVRMNIPMYISFFLIHPYNVSRKDMCAYSTMPST